MKNWKIIISFTYPHEAHLAKAKLESEGIDVIIKDELTAQVNNFYSNAIGGVKLLVKDSDFKYAYQILIDSGLIKENIAGSNDFWTQFDIRTSKVPLIGKSIIELRLLIIVALILVIILVPIVLLTLPSNLDKLTKNSWCVEKIFYKGKELKPYSYGIRLESVYNDCSEKMNFSESGEVVFPGINSYCQRATWALRDDSLFIAELSTTNNFTIGENLEIIEIKDTVPKSIYLGAYSLKIENNMIKIQSDSLVIIGTVYNLNFRF